MLLGKARPEPVSRSTDLGFGRPGPRHARTTLSLVPDACHAITATLPPGENAPIAVGLRSSGVSGTVLGIGNGQYGFTALSHGATLTFTADGYSPVAEPVGDRSSVHVSLVDSRVTGTVLDGGGQPIVNVLVQAGDRTMVPRRDGTFTIDDAAGVAELRLSALGFDNLTVPVDASLPVIAQVERITIKAS